MNPLQIVIPTGASHPRRGWEAERRDLRVPQVSGFSRPGFRHEAQLPPEKKLRTENRQLTTAFLNVIPSGGPAYRALREDPGCSSAQKLEPRRRCGTKDCR